MNSVFQLYGEQSRLGYCLVRPRVKLGRVKRLIFFILAKANDEGVIGCARGGRVPHFKSTPNIE